ncbi:hypothetical protein B0H14DRAFT_3169534 [Mycena olivaceomarginata]|nr:hypothetical protein B0H14DRAFT_3169534 [Mycena olivaceomarginata]
MSGELIPAPVPEQRADATFPRCDVAMVFSPVADGVLHCGRRITTCAIVLRIARASQSFATLQACSPPAFGVSVYPSITRDAGGNGGKTIEKRRYLPVVLHDWNEVNQNVGLRTAPRAPCVEVLPILTGKTGFLVPVTIGGCLYCVPMTSALCDLSSSEAIPGAKSLAPKKTKKTPAAARVEGQLLRLAQEDQKLTFANQEPDPDTYASLRARIAELEALQSNHSAQTRAPIPRGVGGTPEECDLLLPKAPHRVPLPQLHPETRSAVQDCVRRADMDLAVPWDKQPLDKRLLVINARMENDWATQRLAKQFLKNKRNRAYALQLGISCQKAKGVLEARLAKRALEGDNREEPRPRKKARASNASTENNQPEFVQGSSRDVQDPTLGNDVDWNAHPQVDHDYVPEDDDDAEQYERNVDSDADESE